ncbi:hypothetical protein MN608_07205 [Microdochium nivale]|nr:hypothetical protein MN608_07205 [Microdochium nivale]
MSHAAYASGSAWRESAAFSASYWTMLPFPLATPRAVAPKRSASSTPRFSGAEVAIVLACSRLGPLDLLGGSRRNEHRVVMAEEGGDNDGRNATPRAVSSEGL